MGYIYDAVFAVYEALKQLNQNCSAVADAVGVDVCSSQEVTTAQLRQVIAINQFQGETGLVAFEGNDPVSII